MDSARDVAYRRDTEQSVSSPIFQGARYMDRLIGILRRPDDLVAVRSRQPTDPTAQTREYVTEKVRFGDALVALVRARDVITAAGSRRAAVRSFAAQATAD